VFVRGLGQDLLFSSGAGMAERIHLDDSPPVAGDRHSEWSANFI